MRLVSNLSRSLRRVHVRCATRSRNRSMTPRSRLRTFSMIYHRRQASIVTMVFKQHIDDYEYRITQLGMNPHQRTDGRPAFIAWPQSEKQACRGRDCCLVFDNCTMVALTTRTMCAFALDGFISRLMLRIRDLTNIPIISLKSNCKYLLLASHGTSATQYNTVV